MRRLIVTGVCVVLLAACGGTSFKASVAPPTSTTTTTVESAEAKAWVEAAVQGVLGDPENHMTRTDATCISRALVDTITVTRLKAAGTTLTDLSDSTKDLPPRLGASLPIATQLALGKAMQSCRFGELIGPEITGGIADSISGGYRATVKENDCVATWFDAPAQRQLVADIILNSDPSASEAKDLAQLISRCLDVGAMMGSELKLTLSVAERECINRVARTDEHFLSGMASAIQGTGDASSLELFGASIVKCLTPTHVLQLGRAKTSPQLG